MTSSRDPGRRPHAPPGGTHGPAPRSSQPPPAMPAPGLATPPPPRGRRPALRTPRAPPRAPSRRRPPARGPSSASSTGPTSASRTSSATAPAPAVRRAPRRGSDARPAGRPAAHGRPAPERQLAGARGAGARPAPRRRDLPRGLAGARPRCAPSRPDCRPRRPPPPAAGSACSSPPTRRAARSSSCEGAGFSMIPSARTQATLGPAGLERSARAWSLELRQAGCQPQPRAGRRHGADLTRLGERPDRAVPPRLRPGDPTANARYAAAFVRGSLAARVAPTRQALPRPGPGRGNTDVSATGITDSTTTATTPTCGPFRAGIAAGAPLVMVSSAYYPRLDAENRAMFSKAIVTDLLRGRLGLRRRRHHRRRRRGPGRCRRAHRPAGHPVHRRRRRHRAHRQRQPGADDAGGHHRPGGASPAFASQVRAAGDPGGRPQDPPRPGLLRKLSGRAGSGLDDRDRQGGVRRQTEVGGRRGP